MAWTNSTPLCCEKTATLVAHTLTFKDVDNKMQNRLKKNKKNEKK